MKLLYLCLFFVIYRSVESKQDKPIPPPVEQIDEVVTAQPLSLAQLLKGVVEIVSKPKDKFDFAKWIKEHKDDKKTETGVAGGKKKPDVQILPMPIAVGEPNGGQKPVEFSLDGYFYQGAKKIAAYRIDFRGVHFKRDKPSEELVDPRPEKPKRDYDEEKVDPRPKTEGHFSPDELVDPIPEKPVKGDEDKELVDPRPEKPLPGKDKELVDPKPEKPLRGDGITGSHLSEGQEYDPNETTESVGKTTEAVKIVTHPHHGEGGHRERTPTTERMEVDPTYRTSGKTAEAVASTTGAGPIAGGGKSTTGFIVDPTYKTTGQTDDAPEVASVPGPIATAESVKPTNKNEEPVPTTPAGPIAGVKSSAPAAVKSTTGKDDAPVPYTPSGPIGSGPVYTGMPPKFEFGEGKCTVALEFSFNEKAGRCLANGTHVCSEEDWDRITKKTFGVCMKSAPRVTPADNNVKSDCGLGKIYAQVPGEPSADLYGRRCADNFCPKEATCVQGMPTTAHCCILPRWAHYGK